MGKKIEMVGKRFGRLVVIGESAQRKKDGSICYLCKCDCGKTKIINGMNLRRGDTLSCGCYNREIISKPLTKIYDTPLYKCWQSMKQRCLNNKSQSYNNYGKRGIGVCDDWKDNFIIFKNWAINNGYKKGLTLDRIDNNGNYEPSNCRWVTMSKQQNNKRTNRLFTYENETHTIKEWSNIKNINYATLLQRINNNKDPFAPIDISKRHNCKIH